jgi:hypothetical protein
VHPQWFWADYVQVQLLGVGLRSQTNAAAARSPVFYVDRLLRMDPVLVIFSLAGLTGALHWSGVRKRPAALLAICGAAATAGALCVFGAKHLPYIVFLLPLLCVISALCGPRILQRPSVAVSIVAVLFAAKAIGHGAIWSLRPASPPIEGAQAMQKYSDLQRGRELITAQPDDEFYSATLPLPRVRYCFLDPAGSVAASVPYYAVLGITLDAGQFLNLPAFLPAYAKRLRDWGLHSTEPVGSVIVLRNAEEIAQVVQAAPGADFSLPTEWVGLIPGIARTHEAFSYSAGRTFLLRRTSAAEAR